MEAWLIAKLGETGAKVAMIAIPVLLGGVIAQLLSQGLAINKREIEITKEGIRIKGGGGAAATAIDKAKAAADALPKTRDGRQG